MSFLFWSSREGCVGGLCLSRYLASFDDIPESEFYVDVDNSMLFVPDFPFDQLEVE